MPTKIRLQRFGKKKRAFYHIVIADGRAPRDGKYIEKIGTYDPITKPATIDLDFDRALHWLSVGAQPTNTARAILSHKGVLMRHHLNGGVLKGAFSEQEADAKFKKWLEEKEANIQSTAERNLRETEEARQARVNKEKQINEQRVAELRKKKEEAAKAEAKAAKEAETASEENEEEATTEEMKDSEEKNA